MSIILVSYYKITCPVWRPVQLIFVHLIFRPFKRREDIEKNQRLCSKVFDRDNFGKFETKTVGKFA